MSNRSNNTIECQPRSMFLIPRVLGSRPGIIIGLSQGSQPPWPATCFRRTSVGSRNSSSGFSWKKGRRTWDESGPPGKTRSDEVGVGRSLGWISAGEQSSGLLSKRSDQIWGVVGDFVIFVFYNENSQFLTMHNGTT